MRRFFVFCFLIITSISLFPCEHRFCSLSPSITEIFYEISAEDCLFGVLAPNDYPKEASQKEVIGSYHFINYEKIFALKIDECLTLEGMQSSEEIRNLERMNIKVTIYKVESLNDIVDMLLDIGKKTGKEKIAQEKATIFYQKVEEISARTKVLRKGVFLVGVDPIVVVGKGSYLNDVMERVGIENAFKDTSPSYFSPPIEKIIEKKVDVIIVLKGEIGSNSTSIFKEKLKIFNKNLKIVEVEPDTILRPTLRLYEGIKEIYLKVKN